MRQSDRGIENTGGNSSISNSVISRNSRPVGMCHNSSFVGSEITASVSPSGENMSLATRPGLARNFLSSLPSLMSQTYTDSSYGVSSSIAFRRFNLPVAANLPFGENPSAVHVPRAVLGGSIV